MFSNLFYDAIAYIRGGKSYPRIDGLVTFKETKDGVIVNAKIKNLPVSKNNCPGRFFGFHIHEGSSCSGNLTDEFANTKSHFNPTDCPHPFHAGDLPPLIENNGYASMSVLVNKFKIKDIINRTVVIHDSPDDFTTQPSGNSGTKIACGKIEK